ncbi:MAG: GGDEF domain-containing protein, partial [Alphaproteobacteria bacterium]|nr:GGDEF domain-containing protein [Alphaproteobacteria bacterium]
MKVSSTGPVGTTPVRRLARTSGTTRASSVQATDAYASTAPPRQVDDTVSVMGIPQAEITPKVRDALMNLMAEVDQMRRELQVARERLANLERLADRDPLIPIANRRAFVREMTRNMALAERYGTPSSVVYIDVNDFKEINDSYGHSAGDEALKHVADLLLSSVRESDVVGRLGRDEFGVILDRTDQTMAREKAEYLAQQIMKVPMNYQGREVPVHVAVGVYTFTGAEDVGHALA